LSDLCNLAHLLLHPMRRVIRTALQRSMRIHNPTIYLIPSLFKQRSATEQRRGKASNCNRFVTASQRNRDLSTTTRSPVELA